MRSYRLKKVATGLALALLVLALPALVRPLDAQEPEPERVQEAKLARTGAALRVAFWRVADLPDVQDGSESRWPLLEGSFRRGLDRHLAIESTIGVWRRHAETESGGGVIGGSSGSAVTTWVIPLLTSVKFYPFTGPEAGTEPFLSAGAGFALGIEEAEAGGTLTGGGTRAATGFALEGETGAELRLGEAFGLILSGGYQWIRFGEEIGRTRTYAGFNLGAGLTYRFQY